jgi:hypothetical protein
MLFFQPGRVTTMLLMTAFYTAAIAQDTLTYRLRLAAPVIDLPQQADLPYRYPSMNQSLEFASDMYELSFLGVDVLGDRIFKHNNKLYTGARKFSNHAFKYLVSLAISQYGSELPIPMGVWAHEEFHRSVLGVNGIRSKNGNWIFGRWDGTVYGVTDAQISRLKSENPGQLLYSYVSGVHSEIRLNQKVTLDDFYKKRTMNKPALLLYNAYYVYNYFNFSASAASDSVKMLAPPHENGDPAQRDFAGADLTAWVYDMFNPDSAYTSRDAFPGGSGVNRRVGFGDLSPEAQQFLEQQKKLSLLNFINPAIFFVNRIRLSEHLAMSFFMQYAPTHFGNDIAYMLPVQYKQFDLFAGVHTYHNRNTTGAGIDLGLYHYKLTPAVEADLVLHAWNQPVTYAGSETTPGGAAEIKVRTRINDHFLWFAGVTAKSKGWMMGNPYIGNNIGVQLGMQFNLTAR